MRNREERISQDIVVEVRLSDEALADRIARWLDGNAGFSSGPAHGPGSVIVADHVPDDSSAPVVLLAGEDDPLGWPHDRRIAARLSPEVDLVRLRIAVEAAAHGMSIKNSAKSSSLENGLTARETEVLQLLVEGASNKVIARALDISTHTVKFHVASILEKLGAASRTEAVMNAIRLGLFMV